MFHDLETPILTLGNNYVWTLRNAVEGVQIFGGIGSGKTSGSGRKLAQNYLKAGYGGLVLSVKPDERKLWESYCQETGRLDDLLVIHPDNPHRFNFIDYEMNRKGEGAGLTENLVMVLKTVINAGELQKKTLSSNDAFWDNALDMLIFNIVDLCQLAYGTVTLKLLISIAQSIPDNLNKLKDPQFFLKNEFGKALIAVRCKRESKVLNDKELRLYEDIENYFLSNLITLNDRTRSVIEHSFLGLLFQLNRDPIYSLFCSSESNFSPEDSLFGKIIFLDLPIKYYDKVGRGIQILFKYVWQRAMERRNIEENDCPVFLWADEAQNFIHEHDIDYQATARSARVCTVYLTQNLPNYMAHMGGDSGKHHVQSFLGTLGTKIFHANTDHSTNQYAADLIGKDVFRVQSESKSLGKGYSKTQSWAEHREYLIQPEDFVFLKTGGKKNNFKVEGIMHCQDAPWKAENNYLETIFNQKQ